MLADQIMSFLKRLIVPGVLPSVKEAQAPANPPIVVTTSKPIGNVGNNDFFHPLLGYVMIVNEKDMLNKFLKVKPSVFLVTRVRMRMS